MEHVLEQTGYTDVARLTFYIGSSREKIRNMNSTILDYKDVVNSYVKVEGLARKGEFHGYIFRGRADSQQLRCRDCQLLAQ